MPVAIRIVDKFSDLAGRAAFSQIEQIATNKLLGRYDVGSGDIQLISIGDGLELANGELSASGGVTINPTDGVIPYRSGSSEFSDSPLVRASATIVGIGGATDSHPGLTRRGSTNQFEFVTADGSSRTQAWIERMIFSAGAGNYVPRVYILDPGGAGSAIQLARTNTIDWSGSSNDAFQAKILGLACPVDGLLKITDGGSGQGALDLRGFNFRSGSADPTTDDIPSGECIVWKNTISGTKKLWCNDGGSLVSVSLS